MKLSQLLLETELTVFHGGRATPTPNEMGVIFCALDKAHAKYFAGWHDDGVVSTITIHGIKCANHTALKETAQTLEIDLNAVPDGTAQLFDPTFVDSDEIEKLIKTLQRHGFNSARCTDRVHGGAPQSCIVLLPNAKFSFTKT